NGHSASITYTSRGEPRGVSSDGEIVGSFTYSLSGHLRSRFALGSTPKTPFQTQRFDYDQRGRLKGEGVAIDDTRIARRYDYTPKGDVKRVELDELTSDKPGGLRGSLTFGYDVLHRLTSSGLSLDLGSLPPYNATWSYSPAGNPLTINAGATVDLPDRSGASFTYGDGNSADVQAVTALLQGNTTLASFNYDRSGNVTQRAAASPVGSAWAFLYDTNDQILTATNARTGNQEDYYYGPDRRRFLAVDRNGFWRFYLGTEYELDVSGETTKESIYPAGGI